MSEKLTVVKKYTPEMGGKRQKVGGRMGGKPEKGLYAPCHFGTGKESKNSQRKKKTGIRNLRRRIKKQWGASRLMGPFTFNKVAGGV